MSGRPAASRDRSAGQSLVEYAISVPVFLLILLGMLEFGFAFSHHMTLEYATREGARTGAALAAGSPPFQCTDPDPDNVIDNQVIAAVQRVLTGAGSKIDISSVGEIHIYKAGANGQEGGYQRWIPGAGPTVNGTPLQFKASGTGGGGWACSSRSNSAPARVGSYPDSIGISITYTYRFVTPLGSILSFFGSGAPGASTLAMTDRTVMALNPTPQ